MSNKTATFSIGIDYVDEDGADQTKTDSVACLYNAVNRGILDVPAGTTVTGVRIRNRTLQDLTLKINGSAALQKVAAGGAIFMADPTFSAAPITAITLTATTTETLSASIGYVLFGDPV